MDVTITSLSSIEHTPTYFMVELVWKFYTKLRKILKLLSLKYLIFDEYLWCKVITLSSIYCSVC